MQEAVQNGILPGQLCTALAPPLITIHSSAAATVSALTVTPVTRNLPIARRKVHACPEHALYAMLYLATSAFVHSQL